ncbi:MAG: DUF4924 family protein [Muribaculum sp.]|nr:DUF4924 family protein [Muribaculum sp.]
MLTASEKKRENIAEYLLYMWQIEDLIRANKLDIDLIKANIIDKYTNLTDQQRKELTEWYESLIDMMRREDVVRKGHLQINKNVMLALEDLHRKMMADSKFAAYSTQYYATLPLIVELRAKAGDNKANEIETCFNALYMILMMKMAGKEISKDTADAARQISKYLAILAHYYKLDYNNELFKD